MCWNENLSVRIQGCCTDPWLCSCLPKKCYQNVRCKGWCGGFKPFQVYSPAEGALGLHIDWVVLGFFFSIIIQLCALCKVKQPDWDWQVVRNTSHFYVLSVTGILSGRDLLFLQGYVACLMLLTRSHVIDNKRITSQSEDLLEDIL